jgi:ubiquitin carboxyl-terminal hydrolase 5/13
MNSVLQTLGALKEVSLRYGVAPGGDVTDHGLFRGITPSEAPNSLIVQTTKVVSALTSGAYAIPKDDLEGQEGTTTDPKYRVAPRMFKHLIGRDHVDFRTGQQQDAAQFLQYLLEQVDRAEAKLDRSMLSTSHLFSFQTETRIMCSADNKIKYRDGSSETIWSLRLPMDKSGVVISTSSSNVEMEDEPEHKKLKQDEKVIPTVTFGECVASWAAESTLDDYRWPHLQNATHTGIQKTRFQNFPRYLWIQVQRYTLDATWQPIKLEVNLDIAESIDLSEYKALGPQDGEALILEEGESDGAAGGGHAQPEINEMVLGQLMDMGFNVNGCKRALIAVGRSDAEAAMAWIFEHATDPDFNDPLPEGTALSSSSTSGYKATSDGVDDAVVMSLVDSLGCFTIDQVRVALKETQGAPDRAAEWLFSHMDDLDNAIASVSGTDNSSDNGGAGETPNSSIPKEPLDDGDGKYTMVGMISHIGKNTGSGHYVAHIKHDDKWVIFNDEKVALSENPPIQHAYLYLFQRTDTIGIPHPKY